MQTPWEATNRVISLSLSPLRLELPQARSLICKESGWAFNKTTFEHRSKYTLICVWFLFWTQKVSSVSFQYLTIKPNYAELCILVTIPLYGQKKVFNKSMSQWHMECLNKFGKKWLIELVSTSTFRILFDRHLYHLAKRQQQPIYGKCSKPNWFTSVVGFIKRNILLSSS